VQHLEAALTHGERSGDIQVLSWASATLAEVEILHGRADGARTRLLPLLDRPGVEGFFVVMLILPTLAWAYLEAGEMREAERTIAQALHHIRAHDMRLLLVEALRVQALILIRQDARQDAEQIMLEGLGLAREMPNPYAEARLLHVYGRLCARQGEPAQARERLDAALAIFRRLGACKDIEQTEQLLSSLG
jgi:ATP/maltotriose-dependent transcriptional regulator MalT